MEFLPMSHDTYFRLFSLPRAKKTNWSGFTLISSIMYRIYALHSTHFMLTLDITTKFVIRTIWMSRNLRSRGDSYWEMMQEYFIKTSSNIYFGYLFKSPYWGDPNKYSKHMFYEEIRNEQGLPYILLLSIKDSLQQEIHVNGNIFGNKCCRCNEGSLYIYKQGTSLSDCAGAQADLGLHVRGRLCHIDVSNRNGSCIVFTAISFVLILPPFSAYTILGLSVHCVSGL